MPTFDEVVDSRDLMGIAQFAAAQSLITALEADWRGTIAEDDALTYDEDLEAYAEVTYPLVVTQVSTAGQTSDDRQSGALLVPVEVKVVHWYARDRTTDLHFSDGKKVVCHLQTQSFLDDCRAEQFESIEMERERTESTITTTYKIGLVMINNDDYLKNK